MQQTVKLHLTQPSNLLGIGPHPRQAMLLLLQQRQSLEELPSSQAATRLQAGRQQMRSSRHSWQAPQRLQRRKTRSRTLVLLSLRPLPARLQQRTKTHRRR
jgi:hypothetical protein